MTTTAKELTTVAHDLTVVAQDYDVGSAAYWSCMKASKHILATVRDDDDEPLTPQWLTSITEMYGDHQCYGWFLYHADGDGLNVAFRQLNPHASEDITVSIDPHGPVPCKTRGQVRRLCAALGIELKS